MRGTYEVQQITNEDVYGTKEGDWVIMEVYDSEIKRPRCNTRTYLPVVYKSMESANKAKSKLTPTFFYGKMSEWDEWANEMRALGFKV